MQCSDFFSFNKVRGIMYSYLDGFVGHLLDQLHLLMMS
jgi:hypothetical protein